MIILRIEVLFLKVMSLPVILLFDFNFYWVKLQMIKFVFTDSFFFLWSIRIVMLVFVVDFNFAFFVSLITMLFNKGGKSKSKLHCSFLTSHIN